MPKYDIRPAVVDHAQEFRQNTGQDPARYLVPDGNLFHPRPYLTSGDLIYVWPVGVEGIRHFGNSAVAIHRYIGDSDVDVQVVHKDEARIEMSGTFPGITAVDNMAALKLLVRDQTPDPGKTLFLPGIFERVQYVVVENYDFVHAADDRTHSFDYTITFIRTGPGRRIADPHGTPAPPNPTKKVTPRGHPGRYTLSKSGSQTFRQIAKRVYGSSEKWKHLADLNARLVQYSHAMAIPFFQLPTYRWPLGTKIFY